MERENGMNEYFLAHGSHDTPSDGRCAMEWVAYIAGESHTDSPVCVSPVLRSFSISLNDNWDDEQRQKLRPYLARCIGTAGDGRDEERGWLAMDWLVRTFTPRFLDLCPELAGHATKLRALSPVMAPAALNDAMVTLREAREAAAATRAAAGAAAGDAARAAARAAARNAAGDAARAAAGAAVGAVARAAARNAAGDVVGDAVRPAVKDLQASALDLFDRMLPTVPLSMPVAVDAEAVCSL